MHVALLVLNYNGRQLLARHLPSVVETASAAGAPCDVHVVDNSSSDDSRSWMLANFPQVRVWRQPNRGLCSYNDVLAEIDAPIAILLNNDIRVERDFVARLIEPLAPQGRQFDPRCFMAAPLCWHIDGQTCEGFKTAVRWRWGLVQATGRFDGHERQVRKPGLTASAGAAMAVDRRRFLELGGFDPLYLPGRIEDLDFAYRGYLAGYHARYVPEAVCHHEGMATFGAVFGEQGCDHLALCNTLLFQWKNLSHPAHRARQIAGAGVRLAADVLQAGALPSAGRWRFARALAAAWRKRSELRRGPQARIDAARECEFFRQFAPPRMRGPGALPPSAYDLPRGAANRIQPALASSKS